MRTLVILLALLLLTCARGREKPDDPCKSEYRETIMECRKAKKEPKRDCVPVYENGRYAGCVNREELRQILREGGPR